MLLLVATVDVAKMRNDLATGASMWWIFLITGSLWILFSFVIFRFDWTTISSIAIMFGVLMIAAAFTECVAAFVDHGWWRVARIVLAIAFLAIGIAAFDHPGNTVAALAAVISFYFIFKGIFDVVVSLARWGSIDHAWLLLLFGLVELGVGFWAAGNFGDRLILLVVWVGVSAMMRGITEIILAFNMKNLRLAPA